MAGDCALWMASNKRRTVPMSGPYAHHKEMLSSSSKLQGYPLSGKKWSLSTAAHIYLPTWGWRRRQRWGAEQRGAPLHGVCSHSSFKTSHGSCTGFALLWLFLESTSSAFALFLQDTCSENHAIPLCLTLMKDALCSGGRGCLSREIPSRCLSATASPSREIPVV